VIIKVIDNGKGIPKSLISRIFEPFFSHEKEAGNGLGMPMVKKFVEGHGGTVRIESEVGKGTTIVIHIPQPEDVVLLAQNGEGQDNVNDDTLPPK